MDAKQEILAKLQRQIVEPVSLPEVLQGDWIRFSDPLAHFVQTLEMVGGSCCLLENIAELPQRLEQSPAWREAQQVFSTLAEVPGNVNLAQLDDPHLLKDLDFVIYPAEFAVAENGALWLTDRNLRHRVVFFITQFLVLVVRRQDVLSTMHQAYARAEVPQPGFGLFLAGPSKTADIEQSLVIGAHGCRELQVYIV